MNSPATLVSRLRARSPVPLWALVGLGAAALGVALAWAPWVAAGIGFGAVLLAFILTRPLLAVGLMLAIGPVDLAFLTGGFKALFPELGGIDMNGIRLVGFVGGLSVLALTDRDVLAEVFGRNGRWYVAFLAFALATLAISPNRVDGLRLLFKLAYPFLVFVTVLGIARTREQIERLADAALAGAAVITVVINPIVVLTGGYQFDQFTGGLRFQGVGIHQNPFSFYLLAMLLIAFVRFAMRRRLIYLLLCGVFGAWIVLTMTRITFLASVVTLLAITAYAGVAQRNYRALAVGLVIAAAVAVPFVPIVLERTFYGEVPSLARLLDLARDPVALYYTINLQGRELLWAILAANFLTSPVFGLGLGAATEILRDPFPTSFAPHNEYMRLLTEAGVVGTALFAVAILRWLVSVLRAGRLDTPLVREFALPAAGAILGWAVISLTDNAFDYYAPFTQYVGFLCAGALVAARLAGDDGSAGLVDAPEPGYLGPGRTFPASLPAPVAADGDGSARRHPTDDTNPE